MKVVSNPAPLFVRNERAFVLGTAKSLERARRNLKPSGGTGRLRGQLRVEPQGRMQARVGGTHPGLRAQELGAFIRPRAKQALKYVHEGILRFNRRGVRIRAKRFLRAARDRWGDDMGAALREVGR